MAGTNQLNTMGEGLLKMMDLIGKLKMTPDADLPLLIQIETLIIGKNKQAYEQASANGTSQLPPGMSGGGMGAPMMGGMGGGMDQGMGGMPPGPAPMPTNGRFPPQSAQIPPDEIARMLRQ